MDHRQPPFAFHHRRTLFDTGVVSQGGDAAEQFTHPHLRRFVVPHVLGRVLAHRGQRGQAVFGTFGRLVDGLRESRVVTGFVMLASFRESLLREVERTLGAFLEDGLGPNCFPVDGENSEEDEAEHVSAC